MKRSGFQIMGRLIGLVKPLTGYMILAITMGLIGHLCAAFITVFGGYTILHVLHPEWSMSLGVLFGAVLIFALVRGFLRYAEQACNHFIAFKLLALIRDKVFGALRRLCPAKLEGKDKGNLISIITSDIELLEVFYAHTIFPIAIALLFCIIMVCFIGSYHVALGMTVKTKVRIMITVTLLMSVGFIMMGLKSIVTGCIVLGCVWAFHIIYFIWGVKTIPATKEPVAI